jgi:hypothetical protein
LALLASTVVGGLGLYITLNPEQFWPRASWPSDWRFQQQLWVSVAAATVIVPVLGLISNVIRASIPQRPVVGS